MTNSNWKLLGKNTDYPGNDIAALSNMTLDQCKDRCASTTGCNGIVSTNVNGSCWIKRKMSDTYKRNVVGKDSYQYNGISRTSTSCNNSEDCLKQCEYSIIKENKNCFTGTADESTSAHPLNLISMLSNYSNITTPSACGDKCRTTDKCEGFVWRDPKIHGQKDNCQLRGGFYGHNPIDLINSCHDSGNTGWNTYLCKQPGGTIGEWHACDMSSTCISPYAFCRIGDNRCLNKSQCDWANWHDGTSRDCTRMPLPLPTNFSGTYTINDKTFLITQSKDSSGRLSSNAIIEPLNQDPNLISQFGKISYATIDNNIMTWSWTGPGTGGPWGRGPFFSKLITVGNQTGLTFKRTGNYENKINWLRISKHDNTYYLDPKYSCNNFTCSKDANGKYKTLDDCNENCKTKYTCDRQNWEIKKDINGPYSTLEEASLSCKKPPPRFTCNPLTEEIHEDPDGEYATAEEASKICNFPLIIPEQNITQEMVDIENKISSNIDGQMRSRSNKLQSSYLHMIVWGAVAILVIFMIFYYMTNRNNGVLQTLFTILICILIIWRVASWDWNFFTRK